MTLRIVNIGVSGAGKTWSMLSMHRLMVEAGVVDGDSTTSAAFLDDAEQTRHVAVHELASGDLSDIARADETVVGRVSREGVGGSIGATEFATTRRVLRTSRAQPDILWTDVHGETYEDVFGRDGSSVRAPIRAQYLDLVADADVLLLSIPCASLVFLDSARREINLAAKALASSDATLGVLLTKVDRLRTKLPTFSRRHTLPKSYCALNVSECRERLGSVLSGVAMLANLPSSRTPIVTFTSVKEPGELEDIRRLTGSLGLGDG
jgi:hypothetical protein